MKFYFPDVNVWLALTYLGHKHHVAAASWFDGIKGDTAAFCRVTQVGLLRLLTHPTVMGADAKSQFGAWEAYDMLTSDARVTFYSEPDPDAIHEEYRRLTTASRISHQQWPDAYLVAFAHVGVLSLVTFDRGLSQLTGNRAILLN